ncbi:PilZ domain-containing protein [uncultured Paraglaciecola sp.]|uniref:PilZ domain-containing protein n=1 Tax=uncultured Paraglaciecola sp. TaxID=1765024 RepID=UPI00263763FF|nr:PilZ domain-containing protein [uncultured Paraglaciecola sp.]
MSQDLEEYHDIIEELKPMINEPEFNQVLNQVAAAVPKQKRFLLKMELMRLARPCIRLIDLRGLVDGKCRIYVHQGKQHSLDDHAIETFERQVRIFGEYTIGVYEAVMNTENNFRVMHKKEQQAALENKTNPVSEKTKPENFQAPLIKFGNFVQRGEERMNFSVNIEMFTELNKSIQATTIDVSVNGLKVKASKEHLLKPDDRLTVQFRGLEKEYLLDKRQGVAYIISHVERTDHDQRVHLKRQFDIPFPSFDKFFERFIHGNKRRYKVNLDNTITAIQNKTYEQYYIPNFASIPVFIDQVNEQYTPKYALANDCNREEIQYWANELQDLKIGYLLTEERIKQGLAKGQQEMFIFVFNHIKDEKIYFYSASNTELDAKPELKQLFLGYGARKASWRIYKLQFTQVDPKQSFVPLSIGNAINDKVKRQNHPPSPRLMSRLKNITHVALLTNITDDNSTEHYQKIKIKREQLSQLKVFGHPRNKPPAVVTVYRFKYFNQRRETRFLLRTSVKVTIDDLVFDGHTEDISTQGLRVELDKFFHQDVKAKVSLSFPQLQSVTSKFELSNLPYMVRHLSNDRNVLHLQNFVTEDSNTARRFFEALIKSNRSKLKSYRDEEEVPGIGEALRNIYAQNVINVAFFLRKNSVDFIPDVVATAAVNNRLFQLLQFQAKSNQLNLYPLYRNAKNRHDFINRTLAKIRPNDRPEMRELFVAFDPSQEAIGDAINSYFSEQFSNSEQRRQFITQALKNGQFIALKVFLARTGRPDFETMQSELNYVSSYAVHKAKSLEEQLWNVAAMGDIIDVSDEVLRRFEFDANVIQLNHKPPATHKIKQVGIEQLLKA